MARRKKSKLRQALDRFFRNTDMEALLKENTDESSLAELESAFRFGRQRLEIAERIVSTIQKSIDGLDALGEEAFSKTIEYCDEFTPAGVAATMEYLGNIAEKYTGNVLELPSQLAEARKTHEWDDLQYRMFLGYSSEFKKYLIEEVAKEFDSVAVNGILTAPPELRCFAELLRDMNPRENPPEVEMQLEERYAQLRELHPSIDLVEVEGFLNRWKDPYKDSD